MSIVYYFVDLLKSYFVTMANTLLVVECPICFENIIDFNNRTTTECSHSFHTSCIMKNITHNGFSCPCCRTKMAEEVRTNTSTNTHIHFIEDEDSDYTNDYELYSSSALRGMRNLFQSTQEQNAEQNVDQNAEQNVEQNADADADYDDESTINSGDEFEEEEEEDNTPFPSSNYVVEKLRQHQISYLQLVEALYADHVPENHPQYTEYIQSENVVYGKLRSIISNYQRDVTRFQNATQNT